MKEDNSILMQLCTEGVYRENAFHVIGLTTNATSKQFRRRREDLEAARDMGGSNWNAEFRHWLCKCPIPDQTKVNEAFSFLQDPAKRIIAEFFWFWPVDDSDAAIADVMCGNLNAAIKLWLGSIRKFDKRWLISQHNLAVAYQLLALENEFTLLDGNYVPYAELEEPWRKSFAYWEELADEDNFWDLYELRMREFDDPRLTGGFIRRVRQEFPIAFDNINARLALLFARNGREQDAKRHVRYMKKTMSEIDDVEQSLETLFAPLEHQISRVIKSCDNQVAKDPSAGAKCMEEILNHSQEIITAASYLLDVNNPLRVRILTDIFQACNGYLVAYGNNTAQWDVCLRLNKKLKTLACTQNLQERVSENEKILQGNLDRQIEDNTCCSCGKHAGDKVWFGGVISITKQSFKLYGNIRRNYESFGAVSYSTIEIEAPHCNKCGNLNPSKVANYGPIARALKEGFKFGEKPNNADMRKAWGLPAQEGDLPRQGVGCIIPIAFIAFLVFLGGCALI